MLIQILDILRIVLVSIAFFFGYQIGFANGYNPEAQLHFMIPVIIVAIAGISGLEGLFWGKQTAKAKGFKSDGNYQRQSAFALLSYAVVALLVWFLNWGILAELTIFFAFIFFFTLSAINHAADAIKSKNYKWQNINRPFLTIMLLVGMFQPIVEVLKKLIK